MIKFRVTTYNLFTHTYVIQVITSSDAQFRQQLLENEEGYSIFEIYGDTTCFEKLRELMSENNGTSLSLQYV
jgi:hypothetical protein